MAGALQRSKMIGVLSWDWRDTATPLVNSISAIDFAKSFAGSTGAGNANRIIVKQYTLAASGTQDLDLAGVLTDFGGTAVT